MNWGPKAITILLLFIHLNFLNNAFATQHPPSRINASDPEQLSHQVDSKFSCCENPLSSQSTDQADWVDKIHLHKSDHQTASQGNLHFLVLENSKEKIIMARKETGKEFSPRTWPRRRHGAALDHTGLAAHLPALGICHKFDVHPPSPREGQRWALGQYAQNGAAAYTARKRGMTSGMGAT